MSGLDIALGIVLVLGIYKGFKKGIFVEVASLVGLIAGVFGAIYFSHIIGDLLSDNVSWEPKYVNLVAFAATFTIIVVVIAMAGKMLAKIADFAGLGIINKLLGAAFGGLKVAFILSVALMWLNDWGVSGWIFSEEKKEASVLYEPIESIAPIILPDLIDDAKVIINETKADMDIE
ncbi:MAG: CvpA family protein [Gilvibacter sp.]